MKRIIKSVQAAEGTEDTRFADGMDMIKDDFDYLCETFEKLDRDGNTERTIALMSSLHDHINSVISEAVSEVE